MWMGGWMMDGWINRLIDGRMKQIDRQRQLQKITERDK